MVAHKKSGEGDDEERHDRCADPFAQRRDENRRILFAQGGGFSPPERGVVVLRDSNVVVELHAAEAADGDEGCAADAVCPAEADGTRARRPRKTKMNRPLGWLEASVLGVGAVVYVLPRRNEPLDQLAEGIRMLSVAAIAATTHGARGVCGAFKRSAERTRVQDDGHDSNGQQKKRKESFPKGST